MFVVLWISSSTQQTVITGPFNTVDEAYKWARIFEKIKTPVEWHVVELDKP